MGTTALQQLMLTILVLESILVLLSVKTGYNIAATIIK